MNPKVKLVLYVVFAAYLAFFGHRTLLIARTPDVASPASPDQATNLVASTNLAAATNLTAPTNPPSATNVAAEAPDEPTARRSSTRLSQLMGYGGGAFLSLIALAILIGHDISRFLANRVDEFVFNDNLEGVKDPDYEEAEDAWRKGDHLGAIRLMRDYLKKHPREQYVALRIAEIYESELHNHLAAALEYEDILKKKLPAERWGWAAIHLANLYSGKLNKAPEAEALLHRIIKQYGQTAAAKKARERLGISEPMLERPAAASTPAPEPAAINQPAPPDSNLPPGFRPK